MFPGESCWKAKTRPVFGRSADLGRHYSHIHGRDADEMPCDYGNCARAKDPFTRKDHYRDHLRDFHKEDLPPRPNKLRNAPQNELHKADRRMSSKWWRCPKCLERVDVSARGWKCCGFECDPSRQIARVGKVVDTDEMEIDSGSGVPNSMPNSYSASESFDSRPYSDFNTTSMMSSQPGMAPVWVRRI
jgi:hypothetical protein